VKGIKKATGYSAPVTYIELRKRYLGVTKLAGKQAHRRYGWWLRLCGL